MKVQEHYAKYVRGGGDGLTVLEGRAAELGYEKDALVPSSLHDPALFQVSCGSGCPLALPHGKPTADDKLVMDLGCGAGHDVLLASSYMLQGKAIGVDLTPEMIAAAKENAQKHAPSQVQTEFLQADFANPEEDFVKQYQNQVDLIVSNGVFNLCRDKAQAFQVVFQLLRPGGRLVFSDVMKLEASDINPNAKIATSINGDVFSS